MTNHLAQSDHSSRPELLEERRLRFHAGDLPSDDINDLGAKLCVGGGPSIGRVTGRCIAKGCGQLFFSRIEADAGDRTGPSHGRRESIGKHHERLNHLWGGSQRSEGTAGGNSMTPQIEFAKSA